MTYITIELIEETCVELQENSCGLSCYAAAFYSAYTDRPVYLRRHESADDGYTEIAEAQRAYAKLSALVRDWLDILHDVQDIHVRQLPIELEWCPSKNNALIEAERIALTAVIREPS